MSKSLIRKNQLHPDIADLVSGYGDNFFITPAELDAGIIAAVLISGNQTISGAKTFATGIVSPLGIGNPGDVSDAEIRLWETSSESYQSIKSVDGGFTFTRGSNQINLEFNSEEISLSKLPGIAYRFKSGYEGTVPIDANVVHVTGGNETISGVKNFTSTPTVNNTGVLLSGQNSFQKTFNHDVMNMNNNTYFFSNLHGLDASITSNQRRMIMMQSCQARYASWNTFTAVAREQDSINNPSTGYFVNNTTNVSGVITNQYRHAVNGTFYSFTGAINPPIDINFGDKVQIGLRVPNYTIGMSAVHNTVDITFFN